MKKSREEKTSTLLALFHQGAINKPDLVKDYLRIRELKIRLWQVTTGEMEPRATLEACPSLLRTYGFFKVGGELPIKLPEDERKRGQMEKEWFNDLLKGVNISSA